MKYIKKNIHMLTLMTALLWGVVIVEAKENKPSMKVININAQTKILAPSENFIGTVRVVRLVAGEDPSNLTCGCVEFQAGARSNWYTHPKGQLLIVTEGSGLIQELGKPIREIKAGDMIWTPPGIKHWHGTASNSLMIHTAVTESLNGKTVDWMEKVTDEQYHSSVK